MNKLKTGVLLFTLMIFMGTLVSCKYADKALDTAGDATTAVETKKDISSDDVTKTEAKDAVSNVTAVKTKKDTASNCNTSPTPDRYTRFEVGCLPLNQ